MMRDTETVLNVEGQVFTANIPGDVGEDLGYIIYFHCCLLDLYVSYAN